jgi:hypothetical protein
MELPNFRARRSAQILDSFSEITAPITYEGNDNQTDNVDYDIVDGGSASGAMRRIYRG